MLSRVTVIVLVVLALTVALAGSALAADPGTQGQPSQTCGSATAPTTPGQSVDASGAAFNPNGVSGGVYAGQQPQNSNNPTSASQYDVACFQVSQSH